MICKCRESSVSDRVQMQRAQCLRQGPDAEGRVSQTEGHTHTPEAQESHQPFHDAVELTEGCSIAGWPRTVSATLPPSSLHLHMPLSTSHGLPCRPWGHTSSHSSGPGGRLPYRGCAQIQIHRYIYISMYTPRHTPICMYINTYHRYTNSYTPTCIHQDIYTNTYTPIYIHQYIHIYNNRYIINNYTPRDTSTCTHQYRYTSFFVYLHASGALTAISIVANANRCHGNCCQGTHCFSTCSLLFFSLISSALFL